MWNYNYYVYIVTNAGRTVLYTGVTNNLPRRIREHEQNRDRKSSFTGKYHCHHLIWYEWFHDIHAAIAREKEIKRWRREKKVHLINNFNPGWEFILVE